MALVLDGNGTMTVGNGDITGLATGALEATAIGAGAIRQVVYARSTTTTTVSSASTFSIISGSITPTSASSKILVKCHTTMSGAGGYNGALTIFRNSTNIGDSFTNWWLTYGGGNSGQAFISIDDLTTYQPHGQDIEYLDSPNSTSTQTYELRIYAGGDSTFYINRYGTGDDPNNRSGSSWITLIEVAT